MSAFCVLECHFNLEAEHQRFVFCEAHLVRLFEDAEIRLDFKAMSLDVLRQSERDHFL